MTAAADYTDEELLRLLSQGNKKAFEIIYRKYVPELYRFARRLVKRKEDCEEILQSVFERLWTARETLRISTLRPYLYNSVRYEIIDYFRKLDTRRRYVEHFLFFEVLFDEITEPDEWQDTEHLRHIVESKIRTLPERVQMAFRMRLNQNLSNTEIAAQMNVSKKTIENYMHMVYAHLRDAFKPAR